MPPEALNAAVYQMLYKGISLTFHCQFNKKSSQVSMSLLMVLCELHCRLHSIPSSKCTCARQVLSLQGNWICEYCSVYFLCSTYVIRGFSSVHLLATNTFASYCDSPFQNGVMKRFYEFGGMNVEGSIGHALHWIRWNSVPRVTHL